MQIVVNKDELKKRGSQIIGLSKEYNEKIREIKNISEMINTCWNGQDAETFTMMLTEKCIPALEQISKTIENFGQYLKQIPVIYDTLEKNAIETGEKE